MLQVDTRKDEVEAKGAWDAWADTWDWKPEDELTPVYLRGLALQWLTGLDQHKVNPGEAIKGVLAKVIAGSKPRVAVAEAASMDDEGAAKAFTKWLRGVLHKAR